MTRIIQIQSFKGGVGKTTTSINLGHALALKGKNVLIVDLDHQGNATNGLGYEIRNEVGQETPTLYHVIKGIMSYEDTRATVRDGLDLIPSDGRTDEAVLDMFSMMGRETVLKRAFEDVSEYDYVLLDCPPSRGLIYQNAHLLATDIIVPVEIGKWSVDGINEIFRAMEAVQKALVTKVDERYTLTDDVRDGVREAFGDSMLPPIRSSSDLMNAPKFQQTIFEYKPRSHGAEDYEKLADYVLNH
jgi:chromosome partitioning protein